MWFDCVVVDRILETGELWTYHIRAKSDDRYPVDRLEDIETEFVANNDLDVGPLRIYSNHDASVRFIKTRPKNILIDGKRLCVHVDHFGIPLHAGYYACVFPAGWRVVNGHIYDPYDKEQMPSSKRCYRGVTFAHDTASRTTCAQFEMTSRRNTFSLGVMALLEREEWDGSFVDELRPLSIKFSDPRHKNHPQESVFRRATDEVMRGIDSSKPASATPGIRVSVLGVSTDLVEWGRYLLDKIRTP